MNKIIVALCLIAACFMDTSCSKKTDSGCSNVSVASEDAAMLAYASANGITATKHSSGMYYQIMSQGTGATPNTSSKVFVKYTGKLPDGTVFDQQQDHTKTGWVLGGLIGGWQIGLPLIQKGGKIKLIIPSSYGYGCNGSQGVIPANSILFFEIELIEVQ